MFAIVAKPLVNTSCSLLDGGQTDRMMLWRLTIVRRLFLDRIRLSRIRTSACINQANRHSRGRARRTVRTEDGTVRRRTKTIARCRRLLMKMPQWWVARSDGTSACRTVWPIRKRSHCNRPSLTCEFCAHLKLLSDRTFTQFTWCMTHTDNYIRRQWQNRKKNNFIISRNTRNHGMLQITYRLRKN